MFTGATAWQGLGGSLGLFAQLLNGPNIGAGCAKEQGSAGYGAVETRPQDASQSMQHPARTERGLSSRPNMGRADRYSRLKETETARACRVRPQLRRRASCRR